MAKPTEKQHKFIRDLREQVGNEAYMEACAAVGLAQYNPFFERYEYTTQNPTRKQLSNLISLLIKVRNANDTPNTQSK